MIIYYLNLLWILIPAIPLCMYKPNQMKKAIYIVLVFGGLWFLATFREGIGFDYHSYLEIADSIAHTNGIGNLLAQPYDIGFTLINKLISLVAYRNPLLTYGLFAALTLLPVAWFVYRYCETAWLSVWLYVTLTFFYTTMNFIRQSLACSILLLGYGFLRDKKLVPYLAVVLGATLFHKTALIMIPVYFLCHIKLNKVWAIVYAALTLVCYVFSQPILNLVTTYIFKQYKDSFYVAPFSPIFLLVPFVVLGTCLALWPTWRKRYPEADMLVNIMLYSAIIWIFITKHFILERFSMYIYIFVMVALPQAIACLRCSKEELETLEEMKAEDHKKTQKSKAEFAAMKALTQKVDDHKKYWISAVAAVLLLTGIYHEFGQQVNGFHNVFPYHSYIEWLDTPGDPVVFAKPRQQQHTYLS